jgi:hypothetical protein
MGQIYHVTKQLSGKKAQVNMPIKDKNNNILTTEREQYLRWKEHFQEVLNQKDLDELAIIPEASMDLEIDIDRPAKLEIQKDIKSLKNKKAPGTDQLNAELFKIDPFLAADTLHPVFHKIWEKAVIPNSWSEGNIIRIPKSGDLTNCNNWRGITLLSIPSKVFCIVLISRIIEAVDKKLRQEQSGFRKGRGCIDNIFVLRNILDSAMSGRENYLLIL